MLEQIKNQLDRLVSVHRVTDLTMIARPQRNQDKPLERELALVKVSGSGEKPGSRRCGSLTRSRPK